MSRDFLVAPINEVRNIYGDSRLEALISGFSCPMNLDVERFLKERAIGFSKNGFAETYLVFSKAGNELPLIGYFALTPKPIIIKSPTRGRNKLTGKTKRRLNQFLQAAPGGESSILSTILIAQLGKNYANNNNKLITGDQLMGLALKPAYTALSIAGGRYISVECEDIYALTHFYERHGFQEAGKRQIDLDEEEFYKKDYMIQMILYVSSSKLINC